MTFSVQVTSYYTYDILYEKNHTPKYVKFLCKYVDGSVSSMFLSSYFGGLMIH